nr:SnoaL-like domain-containing protein [Sphingorhabdus sp. YGSMI21]
MDSPFITGNRFALFIDMLIRRRATGECAPFSEIAIYTVRDSKIVEERYF